MQAAGDPSEAAESGSGDVVGWIVSDECWDGVCLARSVREMESDDHRRQRDVGCVLRTSRAKKQQTQKIHRKRLTEHEVLLIRTRASRHTLVWSRTK